MISKSLTCKVQPAKGLILPYSAPRGHSFLSQPIILRESQDHVEDSCKIETNKIDLNVIFFNADTQNALITFTVLGERPDESRSPSCGTPPHDMRAV